MSSIKNNGVLTHQTQSGNLRGHCTILCFHRQKAPCSDHLLVLGSILAKSSPPAQKRWALREAAHMQDPCAKSLPLLSASERQPSAKMKRFEKQKLRSDLRVTEGSTKIEGVSDLVGEPNLMPPIQRENHKRQSHRRASFHGVVCRSSGKNTRR